MISRRAFLKTIQAAPIAAVFRRAESQQEKHDRFGLHPFIENHPEAVFIMRTDVGEKTDHSAIRNAGLVFSRSVFVKKLSGGIPFTMDIPVKPNMKTSGSKKQPIDDLIGMGTDPWFVGGVIEGIKETGVAGNRFKLREVNRPQGWEAFGHVTMAERTGADIRLDLAPGVSKLVEGRDYNWTDIPNGVWYRKIPHLEPVNTPGSWLLNISKLKGHGMGLTLCCKNIQGTIAHNYQQFCCRYDDEMRIDPTHIHADAKEVITKNYRRHVKDGIPRWDKPGAWGGIWQETWVTRTLDHLSATQCGLCVIEGVYSRVGNGSTSGPHPRKQEHEYNESRAHSPTGIPKDYMSNIVIFGMDPFRTDIIGNWIGGQEPGNFGLFHIAVERGMLDVLDPFDIPVYLWENGEAKRLPLDSFERTPLANYYLTCNYNGQNEHMYHLCDEPFDYSSMPGIGWLPLPEKPDVFSLADGGSLFRGGQVPFEFRLPESGFARLEICGKRGNTVRTASGGNYLAGSHMTNFLTGNLSSGEYEIVLRFKGAATKTGLTLT